MMSFCRPGKT